MVLIILGVLQDMKISLILQAALILDFNALEKNGDVIMDMNLLNGLVKDK